MAITVEVNGQKIVFDTVEEFKAFQTEDTEETVEGNRSVSESATPAEKVEGAKYIVEIDGGIHTFEKGEVVTLIQDDGTDVPLFKNEDGHNQYMEMTDVRLLEDYDEDNDYVHHEDLKVGDRFTFESLDDGITFDFTTGKVYTVTKGLRPRVVVDDRGHELFDHNFDLFNGIKLVTDDVKSEMDYSELTEIVETEVQDGDFIVFSEDIDSNYREFESGKLYEINDRTYCDENGEDRDIGSFGHRETKDYIKYYRKINDSDIELEDGDIVIVTDDITDNYGDSVCSGDVVEVVSFSDKDILYLLVPGSADVRLSTPYDKENLSKVALVCKAKDRLDQ